MQCKRGEITCKIIRHTPCYIRCCQKSLCLSKIWFSCWTTEVLVLLWLIDQQQLWAAGMFTLLPWAGLNILSIHHCIGCSDEIMFNMFYCCNDRVPERLAWGLPGFPKLDELIQFIHLWRTYVAICLHWGSDLEHSTPFSVLFSVYTRENI